MESARRLLLEVGGSAYLAQGRVVDDVAAGRLFAVPGMAGFEQPLYALYRADTGMAEVLEGLLDEGVPGGPAA